MPPKTPTRARATTPGAKGAKARAKTKTKAKPRAKAKPRKVAKAKTGTGTGSKSIKFRARGPYKCTTRDGKGLKGMHQALDAVISNGYNYDKARAAKTLRVVAHPPATEFHKRHPLTKNTRHLPYSAAQGKRMDQQLSLAFQLHLMPTQRVPLRVFVDAPYRAHWLKLKFQQIGALPVSPLAAKQAKRIRTLANTLLPESDAILRWLILKKLTPVSAQEPVAAGAVGTQIDLVVLNPEGEYVVLECKCGCPDSTTHGKNMAALLPPPFPTLLYTSHRHNVLQTLMNTRCYRKTFPHRKVADGLLLRSAREGLFVYAAPAWALQLEPVLAAKMHM